MRKNNIISGAAALVVLASVLTGCASSEKKECCEEGVAAQKAGNLMVAMGALNSIGVMPTDPANATGGEKSVQPDGSTMINVTAQDLAVLADAEKMKALDGNSAFAVTANDPAATIAAFRPEGTDSPGYTAFKQILASNGTVQSWGAGSNAVGTSTILWGNSTDALLIGASDKAGSGVGIRSGLGFFPYGIIDDATLSEGRLGRLVVALDATQTKFGFGIEKEGALTADLASNRVTACDKKPLVFVNMTEAVRSDLGINEVRLSLLTDGDWIDAATGEVHPAETKQEVLVVRNVNDLDKFRFKETDKTQDKLQFDIWESGIVGEKVKELAVSGARKVVGSDGNFDLLFIRDDETEFYSATPIAAGDPDLKQKTVTAVNVKLFIVPRPSAKVESQKLRAAAGK